MTLTARPVTESRLAGGNGTPPNGRCNRGEEKVADRLISHLEANKATPNAGAIWVLGKLQEEKAVPLLVEFSRSEDPTVRQYSSWALGEIVVAQDGVETNAREALQGYLEDSDSNVRENAALALGEIKRGEAAQQLAELLQSEDSEIRNMACALLIELLGEEDPQTRSIAYAQLKEHQEQEEVQSQLFKSIKESTNNIQIVCAASLLSKERQEQEEAQAQLLRCIRESRNNEQTHAALLLTAASLLTDKSIQTLIGYLRGNDSNVRENAALALGARGKTEAVPYLIEILGKDDPRRSIAYTQLRELQEQEEVQAQLLSCIKENRTNNEQVRCAALLLTDESTQALIGYLRDNDSNVRENAALALGARGKTEAAPYLIEILGKDDPQRSIAYTQLRELQEQEEVQVQLLLCIKESTNSKQIKYAASLLDDRSKQKLEVFLGGIPHLIEQLGNEDSKRRSIACAHLRVIPGPEVQNQLLRCIRESRNNEQIRYALLVLDDTFEKVSDHEEAVECLIPCLQSEDESVRRLAAIALYKYRDSRALNPLATALRRENEDPEILYHAATSLLGTVSVGSLVADHAELLDPSLFKEEQHVAEAGPSETEAVLNLEGQVAETNEASYPFLRDTQGEGFQERLIKYIDKYLEGRKKETRDSSSDFDDFFGKGKKDIEEARLAILALDVNFERVTKKTEAVDCLIKCLESKDKDIRRLAAKALYKYRDPKSLEPLIVVLQNEDEHREVLYEAAMSLSNLELDSLIDIYTQLLSPAQLQEEQPVEQDKVTDITNPEALPQSESPIDALITSLQNEDRAIRCSAATELLAYAQLQAAEAKVDIETSEPNHLQVKYNIQNPHARELLLMSLTSIRDSRIVATLLMASTDQNESVRAQAKILLKGLEDDLFYQGIAETLTGADNTSRPFIMTVLGNLDQERAVPFLIRGMLSDSPVIQHFARAALYEMNAETVIKGLELCLEDKNKQCMLLAVNLLASTKRPQVFPMIMKALVRNKDDESTRDQIIEILEGLDKKVRMEGLRLCLKIEAEK